MPVNLFSRLVTAATVLAFCVVVLGAYVRLSDAGLGCPDWPGCYGLLDVPSGAEQIAAANAAYPESPLDAAKAWKEMIHRYLAGVLGLLVFVLAALAWRRRQHDPRQWVALPLGLAVLIVFQALLGMWTVTLLLQPVIVMAHLLGGLTTLALLWLLVLQRRITTPAPATLQALRPRAMLGLILVVSQISLGGWTSANYAALACPDFPTCQTYWWPPMDFREAFTLWRGIGTSYEGGVLDNDARVTIHMMHRLGAVVVLVYLSWFAWRIVHTLGGRSLMGPLVAMMVLLVTQVGLGIANIVLTLPLPVAVAHNAVAALLVLSLVAINHKLYLRKTHELGNSATEHSPSVA